MEMDSAKVMLADEIPEMGYKSPSTLSGSSIFVLLHFEDVDAVFRQAINAGAGLVAADC